MRVTILDCPQRSPEWHQARLGRVTGTRASAAIATLRDGKTEAAKRRNLRTQLVLERITQRPLDSDYSNWAMQQGIEREPDARAIYEAITGRVVTESGFIRAEDVAVGCSLDGHIGSESEMEGIIELKCPLPATHLDTIRTSQVPAEYLPQITHGLWVTGAQWCDWLSYNPDFPGPLQARLIRVVRDDRVLELYAQVIEAFLVEVAAEEAEIQQLLQRELVGA